MRGHRDKRPFLRNDGRDLGEEPPSYFAEMWLFARLSDKSSGRCGAARAL